MITIKQGETYIKRLEFVDVDSKTPIDLTGATAYSEIRNVPGGDLKATAVCTVDTSNGSVTVNYSAAKTQLIPVGQYGYDIWLKIDGEQYPIYTTRIQVEKRYTENLGS